LRFYTLLPTTFALYTPACSLVVYAFLLCCVGCRTTTCSGYPRSAFPHTPPAVPAWFLPLYLPATLCSSACRFTPATMLRICNTIPFWVALLRYRGKYLTHSAFAARLRTCRTPAPGSLVDTTWLAAAPAYIAAVPPAATLLRVPLTPIPPFTGGLFLAAGYRLPPGLDTTAVRCTTAPFGYCAPFACYSRDAALRLVLLHLPHYLCCPYRLLTPHNASLLHCTTTYLATYHAAGIQPHTLATFHHAMPPLLVFTTWNARAGSCTPAAHRLGCATCWFTACRFCFVPRTLGYACPTGRCHLPLPSAYRCHRLRARCLRHAALAYAQ